MGLRELEARLLSGQARAEKVSKPLCHPAQYGRGELHFPPTGERDHDPELDSGDAGPLSVRHQSTPGDHAHQTVEGHGRFCPAVSGDDRTPGGRWQTWAGALSVAAELKSGCRAAQGFSRAPSAYVAGSV